MAFNDIKFKGIMKLDNIHAQNRVLSYDELLLQDYRNRLNYNITSEIEYSTIGKTSRIALLPLDDYRTLVLCYSSTLIAYQMFIVDNSGVIISSVVSLDSIDSNSTPSLVLVNTDKVAMAYAYGTTNARCLIISTSGNTITLYPSTVFNTSTTGLISIGKVNSTTLIIAYDDAVNQLGKLVLVNISGNYIIENPDSTVTFSGINDVSEIKMEMLTSTKGIIIFNDATNSKGKNLIFNVDSDSSTITTNPEFTFEDSYFPLFLDMEIIDETRIILTYSYIDGSDPYFYVGFSDISNNNITNYAPKLLAYETQQVIWKAITKISNTLISISYATTSTITDEYVKNVVLTIDNDKKDLLIEEYKTIKTNSNLGTLVTNACLLDNKVFILYGNGTNLVLSSTFCYDFGYSSTKIVYDQVWDTNYTTFLANFEDTLESGNITGSIAGWRLKRKASDVSLYENVADFLTSETSHTDYLPRNNIDYAYIVFSLDSDDNESLGIEGIDSVNFYGWILTDNTNTYKFDMGWDGLSTGEISSNKDSHVYENYTKYPVVSFGVRNYRMGSIQSIPYSYNSTTFQHVIDESLRKEIIDFLNDGNEKWLKNTSGDILKIITSNSQYKYSDKIFSQPFEIQFEWTEVGIGEEGTE